MNTENNKLIAEFLGWNVNNQSTFPTELHQEEEIQGFLELRFDTDWNWLMKAVEKIENIEVEGQVFSFEINRNRTHIFYAPANYSNEKWFNNLFLHEGNTKIENTYNAIVEFIKWNNEK